MFAMSGHKKRMVGTIFGVAAFGWIALFMFGDWWSPLICSIW